MAESIRLAISKREVEQDASMPVGHTDVQAAIDLLRPALFAAKAEPPLDTMEVALISSPAAGIAHTGAAIVPGGVSFISDPEMLANEEAQAPRMAAKARASRIAVQDKECRSWLAARGLLASLADGREVVETAALAGALAALSGAVSPKAVVAVQTNALTVEAWMLDYASNRGGAALRKRDDALSECMRATGCTYRAALSAWNGLQSDLKRAPRQTDRKLTGQ